jgi:formate hydrogenlyase subunit 3/multisubunit Na+/H+ antiporter MnhD subunit
METGFPLVMLVGPVVAAGVVMILRGRQRVSVIIGLVTVAVLTLLLALARPGTGLFADNTVGFLGRELVLTPFVRSLFLYIYPALGVLFLVAWTRPMGRALVPVGLAVLSPLGAALMVTPAGLGAILLVAAAAVVLPVLHGGKFDAAVPAWRYFLLTAVALAPILLTASGSLLATFSLGWFAPVVATLLLLGGFPFYVWVAGLGRTTTPAVAALVLGLVQLVVVVFLLTLLDSVPAARATAEFQTAIRWSAALTALVGAFQMGRAADWRKVVAGAILLDMGFMLPVTLSPGTDGLGIALPALISRFLSLLLIALGTVRVADRAGASRFNGWIELLRPALMWFGVLSLLGLPLTPGFAGRWAQLAAVGQAGGMWPPVLLVIALAGGAAAILRMARRQVEGSATRDGRAPTVTRLEIGLMLFLLGVAGLLGLFPNLLLGLAARMLGVG